MMTQPMTAISANTSSTPDATPAGRGTVARAAGFREESVNGGRSASSR